MSPLLALVACVVLVQAGKRVHRNCDRPGGEILRITATATVDDCLNECANNATCRAWTFDHVVNTCSLKKSVPKKVFSQEMSCGLGQVAMVPQVYRPVPVGSVIPQGLLATQLQLQANGLSGHLQLFWEDIASSVWIGGPGDTGLHERGPYWLNGIVPLNYLLAQSETARARLHPYLSTDEQPCVPGIDAMYNDITTLTVDTVLDCKNLCLNTTGCLGFVVDECPPGPMQCWLKAAFTPFVNNTCRCIGILHNGTGPSVNITSQMLTYIDYIISQQAPSGWLGPDDLATDPDQYWSRFNVLMSLSMYAEAEPALMEAIAKVMIDYMLEAGARMTSLPMGDSWSAARWQDFELSIQWLFDNNVTLGYDEELWELGELSQSQGFDWEYWFQHLPTGPVAPNNCTLFTHGVNNGQALKSAAVWFRQSANQTLPLLSLARMQAMDEYHGMPTGMFGCDEHLAGNMPSRGTELCTVVETMFSYEVMFSVHGDVIYADRAERIAYNALPATWASPSNSGDMWAHQYLQQVNEINGDVENTHVWATDGPDAITYGLEPNYGCCTANFNQGWPKFASRIFSVTQDNGIAIGLYASAAVTMPNSIGGGAYVSLVTDYPYDDTATVVVLSVTAVPLYVRIPGWATNASVYVNNQLQTTPANGTMFKIECEAGHTTVDINFNPVIRIEPGVNGSITIHRGALLYSLPLQASFTETAFYAFESFDYSVVNSSEWNYAIKLSGPNAVDTLVFNERGYYPGQAPFNKTVTPTSITATARQLNTWGLYLGSAAPPPASPVCLNAGDCGEEVSVVLVPHGATTLRIAELPYYTSA